MDDFALRALAAGFGVALISGPLGCFVVWRRMAFVGDTLSHSALLGVALGFLLGIDLTIGTVAVCVAIAVLLVFLERGPTLSGDTLLGILAHGSLAFGLVVLSFLDTVRIDLMGYLFGDILAVSNADVAWVYGAGAAVLAALAFLWRPLLAITVHADLARVEGVPVTRVRIAFVLLLAVVVALAMKVVGILLVTSLIIIPAATARRFGHEPRVALISFSNFGNPDIERSHIVRDAVAVLDRRRVNFEYDGEMGADVALNPELMRLYPFCRLSGPANVLIMPGLHSAHASTRLMHELGGGTVIGPILIGLSKPVQIVPQGATVNDMVNMAALAAHAAEG